MGETACLDCGSPMEPTERMCRSCGAPTPSPTAVRKLPSDDAPEVDLAPLRIGDVIEGKWRLEGKLGSGGMGVVFLAHDLALDRKVALKVLAANLCGDAEVIARFEREGRATARLEHPNVVPIYGVGHHHGRPLIVMKALEGQALSKVIRDHLAEGRAFTRAEILSVFTQLCAGLSFIHARGYVHRDIKSGNVFVGSDGRVTLLDFGVLRDASSTRLTRSGALLGTPHYIAPEQGLGIGELDSRADLYSAGILLYECLTLQMPYLGDPVTLLRLHAQGPIPDPRALVPGLPAGLTAVIRKALAKKPGDRFATAEAFLTALTEAWPATALQCERRVTAPSRPPQSFEPATELSRPPAEPADSARTLPAGMPAIVRPDPVVADRRERRGTWRVLAAALAALAGGSALSWFFLR